MSRPLVGRVGTLACSPSSASYVSSLPLSYPSLVQRRCLLCTGCAWTLGVLSAAVGLHGPGRHFSSLHLTAVCLPTPVDDGSEQDDWTMAVDTECAWYEWTANAD